MKRSSPESLARLLALAESQGGHFTSKQAERAGFPQGNHTHYVHTGAWVRSSRGVFRLAGFPPSAHAELVRWSLWSRNRADQPQGAYSHQTALALLGLPAGTSPRLHLTVPRRFRRTAAIPPRLALHYADLAPADTVVREGFRLTSPLRTMLDLCAGQNGDLALILKKARDRGLITEEDVEAHRDIFSPHLRRQTLALC